MLGARRMALRQGRQSVRPPDARDVPTHLRDVFGGRNALLIVALALSFTSTWLINSAVYPLTDRFAPHAQYLAPVAGGVIALVFAFVCQYRPRLFTSHATVVFTVVVVETMSVLLYVSVFWESAPLAVFAAVMRWVTCILRDIVLGFALMGLSAPACAGVLVCGYALRYAIGFALTPAVPEVKAAAFLLCFPVGLVLLWPFAKPAFERLRATGTPADLSVTNPLSFLPLRSRMFVAVVLFHAALGFSVTFDGTGAILGPQIAIAFFVCLLVYSLSGAARPIDTLYNLAFLLTLMGLLLVPALLMGEGAFTVVSSALCEVSSSLFALVLWYLVARIGARSPVGALPVLCMIRSARGFGLALGLAGGMFATEAGRLDAYSTALLAAAVSFAFAAFNFNFARSFSFDATVRSIRPLVGGVRVVAEPPGAPGGTGDAARAEAQTGEADGEGADAGTACGGAGAGGATGGGAGAGAADSGMTGAGFRTAGEAGAEGSQMPGETASYASHLNESCAALARDCHLTARESDVLAMLARGRNAAYIQEELSLTRNTVKSYVADVYRKLNVHSHQELIDLVEEGR